MRHRCLRIRCCFSDDADTDSYANRKSDIDTGATDVDTSANGDTYAGATDTHASATDTHASAPDTYAGANRDTYAGAANSDAGFVDAYAGFHTDSRDRDHHQSRLGEYGLRSGDVHLQQSGRQRQSVHR